MAPATFVLRQLPDEIFLCWHGKLVRELTCFMDRSGSLSGALSRSLTEGSRSTHSRPSGMAARGTHVGGYQGSGCCVPFSRSPCASINRARTLERRNVQGEVEFTLDTPCLVLVGLPSLCQRSVQRVCTGVERCTTNHTGAVSPTHLVVYG